MSKRALSALMAAGGRVAVEKVPKPQPTQSLPLLALFRAGMDWERHIDDGASRERDLGSLSRCDERRRNEATARSPFLAPSGFRLKSWCGCCIHWTRARYCASLPRVAPVSILC
jgi:hypothetical protein